MLIASRLHCLRRETESLLDRCISEPCQLWKDRTMFCRLLWIMLRSLGSPAAIGPWDSEGLYGRTEKEDEEAEEGQRRCIPKVHC